MRCTKITARRSTTFADAQISTVIRIVSVFWASASALVMPAIKNLRNGGEFDTDTFLALGGGIYAVRLKQFSAV